MGDGGAGEAWWRRGVVYQIYPRSFADANGDGVGDLDGIRSRLGYLRWLGVDAVWLSPVYRSPMADFGYDISDHCDIDPVFGDLAGMDALIDEAHRSGIRLLLDWVPNHTSDQHPWFVESRSSRQSPKRDWYTWRETSTGDLPNNWRAAFGGPAWTWDDATTQWYLHLFLPQQPDVNWSNPDVEAAQHDVLRFWLDRGVDGFRADVVHLIGKDDDLPDRPPELASVDVVGDHDNPKTHVLLRRIRQVLDSYPGGRPMVGEVNLRGADRIAPYYGAGDELHMVFDFSLLRQPWDASGWAECIAASEAALQPWGAWPTRVLSNHDQSRHRTRYGGSEGRARVAAVVLLTLRGTPFLYAGEELGAQDAVIDAAHRVDPGGRDACRSPFAWEPGDGHGWPGGAWLPFDADAARANVASLTADRSSILWLYRNLLVARRASPALHSGDWSAADAPDGVLEYRRCFGDDVRRVVANFGDEPVTVGGDGDWSVEVASTGSSAGRWSGTLGPEQAVLLRPGAS